MSATHPDVWIDDKNWGEIQSKIPIACVDIVPTRESVDVMEVGLILRQTPLGATPRWCQIGGRIGYGETVRSAIERHITDSVPSLRLAIPVDPQPIYVMQWFPAEISPDRDGVAYGYDPRRHAVAPTYALPLIAEQPSKFGPEALDFAWYDIATLHDLGSELWPGTESMIGSVIDRLSEHPHGCTIPE